MTPRIVAHLAPLSMGILQARILEGVLEEDPPGDLPNSGIKLGPLALQADSSPAELPGKSQATCYAIVNK